MAENSPIQKDWFLFGFTTGAAASVLKTITNWGLHKLGVPTLSFGSFAAGMVLGKRARLGGLIKNQPRNAGEWAIGYMGDTMSGGLFGVGLAYLQAHTLPGNELLKGAIAGALLGGVTLATGHMLKLDGLSQATPAQSATIVATSSAFGALQGYFLGRYGSAMVIQSHPILVRQSSHRDFRRERLRLGPTP